MRALITRVLPVSALILAATVPKAVSEVPQCVPRSDFIQHLKQSYSEEPVATGIADNGTITELLHDGTGDSWTIIMTTPDGLSCRVAAGRYWEPVSNATPRRLHH